MKLLLAILLLLPLTLNADESTETIVLTEQNSAVFRGVVTDASVQDVQMQLAYLDFVRGRKSYPIYLVLDSPGGDVDAGNTFIQFAKTIRNLKTISIFSASMAASIVERLPGERLVLNDGTLMFHRAAGGFRGQFEDGEVESRLYAAKKLVRNMETEHAKRMQMSLADYKSLVVRELWLVGDDSIKYRAADRIVNIKCSQGLIDAKMSSMVSVLFFTIKINFSKCPLLRAPLQSEKEEENKTSNKYLVPTMSNYSSIKFTKE